MSRTNLIQARENMGYTQTQFAEILDVDQPMVSKWETGKVKPDNFYRKKIRKALGREDDEHLFDIDTDEKQSCTDTKTSDTVDSLDHLQDIQESEDKEPTDMDTQRRQIVDTAIKMVGGMSLLGRNTGLAIVSSPVISEDEYIPQATASIDACWELLNYGSFSKVKRVLNANIPKLEQLATTTGTFQNIAANLATQAHIMEANIASHKLDYVTREYHCEQAVKFGALSGDKRLHATAMDWQGNTYIYCYSESQRAIDIFNDALSLLDGIEAYLNRSSLYIQMSIAHSIDKDKRKTRENEYLACKYVEQARSNMPYYPKLDTFYVLIDIGASELDQFEGKVYLHLADLLSSREYAKKANVIFEKMDSRQTRGQSYRSGLLTKKADTARLLNDLGHFTDCLEQGLTVAVEIGSQKRISEALDVLRRTPEKWQKEDKVINLQREVVRAWSNLVTV